MKRNFLLAMCWVALFGNVGVWITGATLAAVQPGQLPTGIFLFVVAASSFGCSFCLRKKLLNESNEIPILEKY